MTDAVRRGVRTALWCVITMAGAIPTLAAIFDLDAGTVAKVTAVFTLFTSVLTSIINGLEDKGTIPAVLKAPASPGENPIPPDASELGE